MLQHQHRMKGWIFLSVGEAPQLLALLFAQKHDSTRRFQYHFILRVRRRLRANKLSLTGLFWVIGCKAKHFQLPRGSAGGKWMHFSKDGVPGHEMRVGAARLDSRSWHAIGAFHLVPLLITAICIHYLWVTRGSHLLLLSSLRPFFIDTHTHTRKAECTKKAPILLLSYQSLKSRTQNEVDAVPSSL